MNSIQIHKLLSKHVKCFRGVYPVDLLPSSIEKPAIIVINLDEHYKPGSHWVTVCIANTGHAEYFDSYGLPPFRDEITAYLQRNSTSWVYNCHRLQGLTSKVCGHYCCIYALHRAEGVSMTSFVNMFEPARHTCNDKKAVRMFQRLFGQCPACDQMEVQQSCKSQV
jgi:hypothetical protein